MNQYQVLATFLIQQYLKPAGWLSPLQTDLICLVLQWLLTRRVGLHTTALHLQCFPTM